MLVREDAEALGCRAEVARARTIVADGTSADRQLAVLQAALAAGASREEALDGVVDHSSRKHARGSTSPPVIFFPPLPLGDLGQRKPLPPRQLRLDGDFDLVGDQRSAALEAPLAAQDRGYGRKAGHEFAPVGSD